MAPMWLCRLLEKLKVLQVSLGTRGGSFAYFVG